MSTPRGSAGPSRPPLPGFRLLAASVGLVILSMVLLVAGVATNQPLLAVLGGLVALGAPVPALMGVLRLDRRR